MTPHAGSADMVQAEPVARTGAQRFALVVSGTPDRPAGSLRGVDGVRHPFTGWLELAAALEAALEWEADQHDGPDPSGDHVGPAQEGE
jgi:hypothetical protein